MRVIATVVLACGALAACAPQPGFPGPGSPPAAGVATAPGAFLFDCVGTAAAGDLDGGGVAVATAVDRALDACRPQLDAYVRLLALQTGTPEAAIDRAAVRRGIADRFIAYFSQHYV